MSKDSEIGWIKQKIRE